MGKVRPQVLAAIICGSLVAIFGMWVGMQMGAVEIVAAIVGSVFGFLGGVSMKILEAE